MSARRFRRYTQMGMGMGMLRELSVRGARPENSHNVFPRRRLPAEAARRRRAAVGATEWQQPGLFMISGNKPTQNPLLIMGPPGCDQQPARPIAVIRAARPAPPEFPR